MTKGISGGAVPSLAKDAPAPDASNDVVEVSYQNFEFRAEANGRVYRGIGLGQIAAQVKLYLEGLYMTDVEVEIVETDEVKGA